MCTDDLNRLRIIALLVSLKRQMSTTKFFEMLKIIENHPSWTNGRSKTFPIIPVQLCVFRGDPESQRGKILEVRIVEFDRERGSLQSCSLDSRSWNSLASDKEFTSFCKSRMWTTIWLAIEGFLCCCKEDNSSILAWIAWSISSQQILLNSSNSWQSLAWSSWKSLFLNSKSPYTLILSLWAWSAHGLAWCNWNRWDSNSWLISLKAKSEFRLSQFLASASASAWYNICWASLSPRTAKSPFRWKMFWRCSLSQRMHNVSRSLFPFDCELKSVVATDSLINSAPISWGPRRPDTWLALCFQILQIPTVMKLCQLLLVCCCWMLRNSVNLLDLWESW